MKKIINHPDDVISELIEGYVAAYGNVVKKIPDVNGLILQEKKDKVAIVVGGGSGHEPAFLGFVGDGLADGVAIGNVFASPDPFTIAQVARAADAGKGVLFLYGNYSGDNLNFDMAEEMLQTEGMKTAHVRVWDDVASAPADRMEDRRGIAGDGFVFKVAGAAADAGLTLEEVKRVAARARDNTRTVGVGISPGTIPGAQQPTFTLPEDEIEFGLGIHGEAGVKRTKMLPADQITDVICEHIMADMPIGSGDEIVTLVNGLGSTTLIEMMIVNRRLARILSEKGVSVYDMDVHSYCTCQEMGGVSISICKLDDELKRFYDMPAFSPYYTKR